MYHRLGGILQKVGLLATLSNNGGTIAIDGSERSVLRGYATVKMDAKLLVGIKL